MCYALRLAGDGFNSTNTGLEPLKSECTLMAVAYCCEPADDGTKRKRLPGLWAN